MQRAMVRISSRLVEGNSDSRRSRRQLRSPGTVRGLRLKEPGIEENGRIKSGGQRSVSCLTTQACGHGRNEHGRLCSEGNGVRFGRIKILPCDRFALVNHNFVFQETNDGPILQASTGSRDLAYPGYY